MTDSRPLDLRYKGEGNSNPLQYSCLENPGGQRRLAGYSPWGSQRVGHDQVTDTSAFTKKMVVLPLAEMEIIRRMNEVF